MKKDVYPSENEEWRRMREAEEIKTECPENVGCNVYSNVKERQLYKYCVVTD